jgi:hypothetical protein
MPERLPKDGGRRKGGRRAEQAEAPPDAHEWISFEDPDEDRTWVFDVTFLASPWTCIYGHGCKGVLTGPSPELEQGCCSYGAHFTDEADAARVTSAAEELTDDQWQFAVEGRKRGISRSASGGSTMTRIVQGACIFLNRPGFPGGAGCALHRAALEHGAEPLERKPDVCWQLPLWRDERTDDDGHVTSTIRQWERKHWGEGGAEFHWWCTESPEAFRGSEPVFRHMRSELVAMSGPLVYGRLAAYLEARLGGSCGGTPLPHPVLRKRRH